MDYKAGDTVWLKTRVFMIGADKIQLEYATGKHKLLNYITVDKSDLAPMEDKSEVPTTPLNNDYLDDEKVKEDTEVSVMVGHIYDEGADIVECWIDHTEPKQLRDKQMVLFKLACEWIDNNEKKS